MWDEDRRICQDLGRHGQALLADGEGALTHCNAGSLATAGDGTALAVFYAAQEAGKRFRVFADETRPLNQGSRLTAWELQNRGIDVTLICDNMAAQVMKEGRIQLVVVGADRIAANGDTANKIGTYSLADLARHHQIPFYVAASVPLGFVMSLALGASRKRVSRRETRSGNQMVNASSAGTNSGKPVGTWINTGKVAKPGKLW